jgi:DNA-binding LacI/PurR family transcriptional regulator/anti-anti-sigma regulatory factor
MNEFTRIKPQRSSPTIGVLTCGGWDALGNALWTGVADAARERGANVICFAGEFLFSGEGLQAPFGRKAQVHMLKNLVSAERLDGLVIWGGILALVVGPDEAKAICERYRPLPMVNVGSPLEGIPSVLVDNYQGMRDGITHLVEVHGCRRIAFVRGPKGHQEADERYRAYTDALTAYHLPFDPDLVAPGEFLVASGEAAMDLLLDERKAKFEAVAVANDGMAMGVLNALQARGIRAPDDIAVIGFDDRAEAASTIPPLTTVRYSFYEQGQQAAKTLLAQIEGAEVPDQVIQPMKLVIRRSCGCWTPEVIQAKVGPVVRVSEPFKVALAARREHILSDVAEAVRDSAVGLDPMWAEQLLDAFAAELMEESPGIFLSSLDDLLRQVVAAGGDVTAWQGALSTLRRHMLPCLSDGEALSRADDIWEQSRVMLAKVEQWAQMRERMQVIYQAQTLREIGQALTTAVEVTELMGVVARGLLQVDIPSCYLSLYEGQEALMERSRLILACDEKGCLDVETDERQFRSCRLAPDGWLPRERCHTMVLEPLYFREDQLGFALFEVGPREGSIYETLRGQISSALKGALLLQERKRAEEALEKAYAEVEKQVGERTAELKREVAERERLQQEIIEAQKQAIQALSTPVIPIMERIIVMPLVGSIDTMRARDITRALLAGIRQHQAKVVILDITGVSVVDSGVADYLNKTIQAARLKGAHTIVTGISEAVAETIVDLGIDWSGIETLADLQAGLRAALAKMGRRIEG